MTANPTDVVRTVLDAIDDRDLSVIETSIAEDVYFRFGNAEATRTRAGFTAAAHAFVGSVAGIKHEILDLWEVDDAVIAVMEVHYERLDGGQVTLPCCNVFRVRDGRVHDYRIYMDINPVFAP